MGDGRSALFRVPALGGLFLFAAAVPALAQDNAPPVTRVDPAPIEQVNELAGEPRAERSGDMTQIPGPARREGRTEQLTGDRRAGGQRSPTSAESLSVPTDGRAQAVTRIAGRDRCDVTGGDAAPALCANAIETRAESFTRPSPLRLSPEARLLVDRPAQPTSVLTEAARQNAGTSADANATDVQGLASMVLQPTPPEPAIDAATLSPDSLAVIQAVVEGITPVQPGR